MEHFKYRLLTDTVKFIELTQNYTLKGFLNKDVYKSMTEIKFTFIRDIIDSGLLKIYYDKKFSKRVDDIIKYNNLIFALSRKVPR